MKVRTTYLIAATKYAAYFVMLVVFQLFLGAKQNVPAYIHAALVGTELLLAWFAFKNWRTYQEIPAEDKAQVGDELAARTQAPGGEKYAWLYLAIGIAALVFAWPHGRHYYPAGLIAGPLLILLGIGGIVDRRILVGLRNDRPEVTPPIRTAAFTMLAVGLAIGGALVFLVESGRI
jgi:hypothetical protein